MPIINGHPRNLTQQLKDLLDNPVRRQELGRQGQEYVRQYHDVSAVIDQCLDLYAASYTN